MISGAVLIWPSVSSPSDVDVPIRPASSGSSTPAQVAATALQCSAQYNASGSLVEEEEYEHEFNPEGNWVKQLLNLVSAL